MPSEYIYTEIDGQRIRLSNLEKVIYPQQLISKAMIIQYYLDIAPLMLPYLKHRPLTLVRYPDGIDTQRFYAKQKPKWAPEWISSFAITHSTEEIHYVVADQRIDLVWLANISALEIHPMQFTIDHHDHPDHFIFDLDPPEDTAFEKVKEIAFLLRTFLSDRGYQPFVKTSGSKGLHVLVPIKPIYTHEEMVNSVKKIAAGFVKKYPDISTLHLAKNKRDNKVLMDIFRNHKSHTTVCAYSLRAKPGAPISMPVSWKNLESIDHSTFFDLSNYSAYLEESKKAWQDFYTSAVELHDRIKTDPLLETIQTKKLVDYYSKRNFEETPEPEDLNYGISGNRYCVQLHDASNLHYDLRLEDEGTLLSWAIPKGLPLEQKIKRLAIRTEDHPLSYLDFEGRIPPGNYGAGNMWIYEKGTFKWIKKEEKKLLFELNHNNIKSQYLLYNTKGDQWLIERRSSLDKDIFNIEPYKLMLAESTDSIKAEGYDYEVKWDGIRCMVYLQGDKVKLISRGQKDLTDKFPEFQDIKDYIDIEHGVFDGEIVCLDQAGKPIFSKVISRMHSMGQNNIQQRSKSNPAVIYLFDCLNFDGKDITQLPLHRRRTWLRAVFKKQEVYRFSDSFEDGEALAVAAKKMGLEGIMMKAKNSPYQSGSRSSNWLKLKSRYFEDAIIIGYTKGKGDRSNLFGSLHLAKRKPDAEELQYMGRVGTGFSTEQLNEYFNLFQQYRTDQKPIEEKIDEEKNSVWLKPILICEIKYASLTNNETFREPIFVKLRLDIEP